MGYLNEMKAPDDHESTPLDDSPQLPPEDELPAAIAATRHKEAAPLQVDTKNNFWPKGEVTASGMSNTASSLLQHSAGKLGPLAQPSFSFSSEITECTSFNSANLMERRARLSNGGTMRNKGNRSATHSNTTPSMAQLRARKIMSEAHKTKSRPSHCLSISPTSEGSDWEEASTDLSSNIDVETVAHVSHFIDSLQKRSQAFPEILSRPIGGIATNSFRSHLRATATTRYQSSLANARNAMAASPIENSFTPRSETMPRRANFITMKPNLDVEVLSENPSHSHVDSPSVKESDQPFPLHEARLTCMSSIPVAPSHAPQVPRSMVADAKSFGDQPSLSHNVRKDVHYYAILARIQKVLRSDNAPMSLGKILADANERGISLDVVTEIYKQERFKESALRATHDENLSRGSSKAVKDEKSDQEEAFSGAPEGASFSTEDNQDSNTDCGEVSAEEHEDVKTSISCEIAADMMELSLLCDQATTLFHEKLVDKVSPPDVTSDLETQVSSPESTDASSQNKKNLGKYTRDDVEAAIGSIKPSQNFGGNQTASICSAHEDTLMAEAVSKFNVGIVHSPVHANARRNRLPSNQLVELYKKECLVTKRNDISDVLSTARKPFVNEELEIFSKSDISHVNVENVELNSQNGVEHLRRDCEGEICIPGLKELQLHQLKHLVKKAEELRDSDPSPQVCIDDAIKKSFGGRRNANLLGQAENLEDIDAFFSRFSIQNDGEPIKFKQPKETKVQGDSRCKNMNFFDLIENSNPEPERAPIGKIVVKNGGATPTPVCLEESSFGVEVVEPVKEEPIQEKENKLRLRHQSGEGNLPKHLALWKSPWQRHHLSHNNGNDAGKPYRSAVVAPIGTFPQRHGGRKRRQCFRSLEKRLMGHTGYLNIDFYSLYESTVVQVEDEDIDLAPWEYRDVGQRFLHEKSLESRNWFGSFELNRRNDRVPNPVCRPKSLEVLVTKIPEPGEWNEDWYTTWKSRKDNPNNLVSFAHDETVKASESEYCVHCTNFPHESSKTEKKVIVEIGSLCPVRVRGGERVSRIHPDFTSSLRQSRWRKKYLKGAMFPTD